MVDEGMIEIDFIARVVGYERAKSAGENADEIYRKPNSIVVCNA